MTDLTLADLHDFHVTDAARLADAWRCLMGGGGFGRRTLWMIFIEPDGRIVPTIVPIDDVPQEVDASPIANVLAHLTGGDEPFGTVALLLSRPGPVLMTAADRAWGRALAPLTSWPVHLATTDQVQVFAADDLT